MVKIKKVFSVFLALVLLISLNTVVFGAVEVQAYRGEKIEKRMSFENTGNEPCYDVWAFPTGDAEDWVEPYTLEFGTVDPGETSDVQDFTITVPKNATENKQYDLIWKFFAEHPVSGEQLDTGARVHYRIYIFYDKDPLWWIRPIAKEFYWVIGILVGLSAAAGGAIAVKKWRGKEKRE